MSFTEDIQNKHLFEPTRAENVTGINDSFLKEFLNSKQLILVGLDHLFGLVDCYFGSGYRRRSARASENVDAVDDLVQSRGKLPQYFSMHYGLLWTSLRLL